MTKILTKDEILALAKEKGIKLAHLNSLIDGYRGKLTDWKNGKTSLTESELQIISGYLLGTETKPSAPVTDDDLKFALFNGAEGITDEMFDEVKAFAEFVRNREENKRKG